ncbi:hypothetical protein D3C79_869370 [compost metagenome]
MVGQQQFTAQGAHQAFADGQAQAQALGAGLGGEERLLGVLQGLAAEAGAVVADVQVDAVIALLGT